MMNADSYYSAIMATTTKIGRKFKGDLLKWQDQKTKEKKNENNILQQMLNDKEEEIGQYQSQIPYFNELQTHLMTELLIKEFEETYKYFEKDDKKIDYQLLDELNTSLLRKKKLIPQNGNLYCIGCQNNNNTQLVKDHIIELQVVKTGLVDVLSTDTINYTIFDYLQLLQIINSAENIQWLCVNHNYWKRNYWYDVVNGKNNRNKKKWKMDESIIKITFDTLINKSNNKNNIVFAKLKKYLF